MEVFLKLTPLLILLITMFTFWDVPKLIFVSIPLLVGCLHLYYPGTMRWQAALVAAWIVLLLGYGRVTAFSSVPPSMPKPLQVVLGVFGAAAAVAAFFYVRTAEVPETVGAWIRVAAISLGLGLLLGAMLFTIIMYVFCPLFVLERTQVETTITDYYKTYGRRNHGRFVRFQDEEGAFSIDAPLFWKVRRKVGVPIAYTKCRCLMGVQFIQKIRIPIDGVGELSSWETSPKRKEQLKILYIALAFCGVSVLFFFIVFGLAGALPWQG